MSNENRNTGTPMVMRNIFGIIMIIVYIGMGVLFFINFFGWGSSWSWVRWAIGSLLVAYLSLIHI